MGLAILIAGLVVFLGPHVFITHRGARAALIARIGLGPYKGLFALLSVIGVVVISIGFARYRTTGWIDVWYPPRWIFGLTQALVWIAFICVAAAYFPGEIKRRLKHPMLVGVKLWAVAHLIANGDLGSIILFGSILAWAVFDRIALKHRADPGGPPIAIGTRRNDLIAIGVATIVFLFFGLVLHPLWIGVPVFGRPAFGG